MDFEEPPGSLETLGVTSDDEWESFVDVNGTADVTFCSRVDKDSSQRENLAIKRESLEDDEESRNNTENESLCSAQLLPNPMAVATSKDDRAMEPDSTQKLPKPKNLLQARKKKLRRGPITHYRGTRKYRQRCVFCQIYLHSKTSYTNHMERFHSGTTNARARPGPSMRRNNLLPEESKKFLETTSASATAEEMIEDVEDELVSLEKDAPLTPVQQNIISQLKTFSCYSCRQTFQDRRSTLNHIRQHMPDLRPYTCIACLTEFADRSIYKLHCGASFQCAMKIALVVPEHGTERYFTCNMCLRPLSDRRELMSHLSKHSDKQYEQLLGAPRPPKLKPMSRIDLASGHKDIPVPYDDGNPSSNNLCEYCGMIYKHKQNLQRHVELCAKLPEDGRISYRCVHCGTTFLAFSKFQSHLKVDHKRRNYVCSHCRVSFDDAGEYLEHYREHRPREFRTPVNAARSGARTARSPRGGVSSSSRSARLSCVLCPGSSFSTKTQLADHRKDHLKLKIYSCPVCREMFGGVDALESHMTEHDHQLKASAKTGNTTIPNPLYDESALDDCNTSKLSMNSDPGDSSSECPTCGKVFASYHSLRRHVRNVHETPGCYGCFACSGTFKSQDEWTEHVRNEHRQTEGSPGCPVCGESFATMKEMTAHRRRVHRNDGDDTLSCYICGKVFETITSLRIHRGHHFRVNSRLSIGKVDPVEDDDDPIAVDEPTPEKPPMKSPRARKSFPNGSPSRPVPGLQCQVCNDRFDDVAKLRKHLWDVHCARNKPEKQFPAAKLQCELCTNVMPDEESLRSHMAWHENNPILSNSAAKRESAASAAPAECDICGKFYSSISNLMKHKKRHKIMSLGALKLQPRRRSNGPGFACQHCKKVFARNTTLLKHTEGCHAQPGDPGAAARRQREALAEPPPPRPKQEYDNGHSSDTRKPVTCNLCRKILPNRQELYVHRAKVHRITRNGPETHSGVATVAETGVSCTVCGKTFSSVTNMRQHVAKAHRNLGNQYRCEIEDCGLVFKSWDARSKHRKSHTEPLLACPLCSVRMINRAIFTEHLRRVHGSGQSAASRKTEKISSFKNINLDTYVVKGANGRQCPLCKVVYPNNKALKIHYIKIHAGAS